MSRFWAADNSSSSESSDDSYASSSEEEVGRATGQNKWEELSEDSSEEDVGREVKSAKDKVFEGLKKHISSIRSGLRGEDWNRIQDEFDNLTKLMDKSKKVIAEQGGIPRFFVRILCDMEEHVRESLFDKEKFKKLSPSNGRALKRLKLTLNKYTKPYAGIMAEYRENPVLSSADEAQDSKVSSDSEAESNSDSDSSSKSVAKAGSSSSSSKSSSSSSSSSSSESDDNESSSESKSDDDSGSDDDSQWASSSSSSSSSSSDDEGMSELKGRAKWLKKTTIVKEKVVKDKDAKAKAKEEAKRAAEAAKLAAEIAAATAGAASSRAILPEDESLTPSILEKKCKEIISSRGRKGADSRSIVRHFEALAKVARKKFTNDPRVEIPVLMHTITAQFDLQRGIDDFMEMSVWRSCHGHMNRVLSILESDTELRLGIVRADDDEEDAEDLIISTLPVRSKMKRAASAGAGALEAVAEDDVFINPETGEKENADDRAERIRKEKLRKMSPEELKTIPSTGSLASFLTRLDEEYTKSLQQTSPHSSDYVVRLRDEGRLVDLLSRARLYYIRAGGNTEAASLAQLELEHLYYRHESIALQVDRASKFYAKYGETSLLHPACISSSAKAQKTADYKKLHPASTGGKPRLSAIDEQMDTKYEDVVANLCKFVYKHGSDRDRTRAMICHIFYLSLHNHFFEARDLLLMSKLQETIGNAIADVPTMILFNRMMVTLGMAAFRIGRIWDAHQCLMDICSGRVKELLAQGVSIGRFSDKTTEQEKLEKRRQTPYHQHINLDLLEATHLISAMLLEVPNIASSADKMGRKRIISRTFRKNFDYYERQVFTSAMPEQTRDFVMCSAKNLLKGDWKKCQELLTSMHVWQLVPGEDAPDKIKDMLREHAKLEGLRTFLFAYNDHYNSLSLNQLCKMFEMEKNEVHSVISKMMINGDLHASWDQPTDTIVLRKVEASNLQNLAMQFSDKAAALLEANERLLESRSGTYRDGEWRVKQINWGERGDGQRRNFVHVTAGRSGSASRAPGSGRGGRGGRIAGGRGGARTSTGERGRGGLRARPSAARPKVKSARNDTRW